MTGSIPAAARHRPRSLVVEPRVGLGPRPLLSASAAAARKLEFCPAARYVAGIPTSSALGGWPSRAAFLVLDKAHPEVEQTGLEGRIAAIVAPTLAGMGYELVRVAVLGREKPTVQVMADREDGSLISIADCETISHALGAVLDVQDPMPGEWTLEVSSAGIDRPLVREKDWNRFCGHLARAETQMPVNGRKRFSGTVLGAAGGIGRLRLDDGSEAALPLTDVRKARLILTDALIAATSPAAKAPEN